MGAAKPHVMMFQKYFWPSCAWPARLCLYKARTADLQQGSGGAKAPRAHTPVACPLGLAETVIKTRPDPEGRPPPANHTAERHAGSPIQQRPGRQPGIEQTLKRSASNRARCATTGAGGCNSHLRPNPPEGIDLRGCMLGDTETALGRQCPNVLLLGESRIRPTRGAYRKSATRTAQEGF